VLRIPTFIDQEMNLDKALEIIQRTRSHIAIVYQSTQSNYIGIITLEDLLEELVGPIYDEHDEVGLVQEIGNHRFEVKGNIKLNHLFSQYLKLPSPVTNKKISLQS
jgi:CBS domain containing-hemolysin-like protein